MGARRLERPQTGTPRSMHACPGCDGEMVHPTDWWEAEGGGWQVELRCPECEWRGSGTYRQSEVDDFDRKLDDGCEALTSDLRHLTRTNMEAEGERFVAALASDSILPEDF
jgi:hypothetical protein